MRSAPSLAMTKGHFGCQTSETTLFIPEALTRAFSNLNARSLEECISLLQCFPSALAAELGWSVEEVQSAAIELYAQLRGLVPAEYLSGGGAERAFGATEPSR